MLLPMPLLPMPLLPMPLLPSGRSPCRRLASAPELLMIFCLLLEALLVPLLFKCPDAPSVFCSGPAHLALSLSLPLSLSISPYIRERHELSFQA